MKLRRKKIKEGRGRDLRTTYSSGKPWTDSGSPVVGSQSLTLNLSVFRNVPLTAERAEQHYIMCCTVCLAKQILVTLAHMYTQKIKIFLVK